jgi:ATP-dependent protease HslVU (ClpYQ) peptidase subunit
MSTVAWDGKTLAADRQATWGNTPVLTKKIARVKYKTHWYLVGWAGNEADGLRFVAHFTQKGLTQRPPLADKTTIIVVSRVGVWVETEADVSNVMEEGKWALGSGGDFALGAMHAGATAEQAIEIASRLDVYTGMGVDAIQL